MSQMSMKSKEFLSKLESNTLKDNELLWWCAVGSGLGRDETSPADFILSSLPSDGTRPALAWRLAMCFAEILERNPTLRPNHPMAEDAMTQMLRVVARLGSPVPLRQAIWVVYSALKSEGKRLPDQLGGALLTALTFVPSSSPVAIDLWFRLLRNESDPLFGGTPDHGIYGLFMTPATGSEEGRPNYEHLGEGLFLLAQTYKTDDPENYFSKFGAKIRHLINLWQINDPIPLIMMAHRCNWHDRGCEWALMTLPTLFSELGELPDSRECVIWHKSFEVLERLIGAEATNEQLCGGAFRVIRYNTKYNSLITMVLDSFEKARIMNNSYENLSEREAGLRIDEAISWTSRIIDESTTSKRKIKMNPQDCKPRNPHEAVAMLSVCE